MPIYLNDQEHWVSALIEANRNDELNLKYFDSHDQITATKDQDWLKASLEKHINSKINLLSRNFFKQTKDSVGCGPFAIENLVKSLDLQIYGDLNLAEQKIRDLHYNLIEKYKGHSVKQISKSLKNRGIQFIDLSEILYIDRGQLELLRGGRKGRRIRGDKEEENDTTDLDLTDQAKNKQDSELASKQSLIDGKDARGLSVSTPISNQIIEVGQEINFKIPEETFAGDDFILRAKLSNGDPLPSWLRLHLSPSFVSSLSSVGSCSQIEVSGDKACLICGTDLKIIDISNPHNPSELGSCEIDPTNAIALLVKDNFAYVSFASSVGLKVIDISNSSAPQVIGACPNVTNAGGQIAYYNQHIYIPSGSNGLITVDVSNPYSPEKVGYATSSWDTRDVVISGNYAYSGEGYVGGLRIRDLAANITHPTVSKTFFSDGHAGKIAVSGNNVYLSHHPSGLNIFDVSNFNNIKELGKFVKNYTPFIHRNNLYHNYAFVGDGKTYVLDVSDTNNIKYSGEHNFSYILDFYKQYLLNTDDGLTIRDVSKAQLTGIPGSDDVGTITVKVIADNMQGQTVETNFDIEVTPRQFSLPTTTPCIVTNQTKSYFSFDSGCLYCMDEVDADLKFDLGCNGETDSTMPNFKNGELGVQLPKKPAVVKPDFKISQHTKGGEVYGDVVALDNTHFVTSYLGAKLDHIDGDYDFYGQVFDTDTQTQSSYFQINTTHLARYFQGWVGNGIVPKVIKLSNGNFVALWLDGTNWPSGFGQIFTAAGVKTGASNEFSTCIGVSYSSNSISGSPLGTGFAVNCANGVGTRKINVFAADGTHQNTINVDLPAGNTGGDNGSIVGLNTGNVVATMWGADGKIYAEILESNGTKVKDTWQVTSSSNYSQPYHSSTLLNNGNFLIVWGGGDYNGSYHISGSIFSPNGTIVKDNFILASNRIDKNYVDVDTMANGNVVIVWQQTYDQDTSYYSEGNGNEIYGAIVDQNGNIVADSFKITTFTEGHQLYPRVSHLGNNKVIVVWSNENLSGSPEMYGIILDANNLTASTFDTCIKGTDDNDQLAGLVGDLFTKNIVAGMFGNDTIGITNGDTNIYSGGAGYDRFVIYPSNNQVDIVDFADDILDLSNFPSITSMFDFNVTQSGLDTLIDLGAGNTVLLKNTTKDNLNGENFKGKDNESLIDLEASNLNQNLNCTEDNNLDLHNIQVHAFNLPTTATLTLSDPAAGIFTTGTSGSTTSTFDLGIWSATGPTLEVNDLLGSVQFQPASNYNEDFTITSLIKDSLEQELTGVIQVNMIPENDFPTSNAFSKSGVEDTAVTFSTEDFTNHFDDIDGDSLTKIQITSLPSQGGKLNLSGSPVVLDQEILVGNLDVLTFDPDPNWNGTTSFGWKGYDGTVYSIDAANVNITLSPQDDIPVVHTISKSGNEDTVVTFSEADFTSNFDDVDGDGLIKIKITNLSSDGVLKLFDIPVTLNREIAVSSLSSLAFEPNKNWFGTANFSWKGYDGVAYSTNSANITITIISQEDAPVVTPFSKAANEGEIITFSTEDFTSNFSDGDGDSLTKVQVTKLPAPQGGVLKLGTVSVMLDQQITSQDLNKLIFEPNIDWYGTTDFSWKGYDGKGYSTSSADVSMILNDIPLSISFSKVVNEDTVATFSVTDFTSNFSDGDGDSLDKIKIVSLPINGILKLSGSSVVLLNQEIVAANLDSLVFEPNPNWFGETSFSWKGFDSKAYSTSSADVNITVNSQNDLPAINLDPSMLGYSEGDGTVIIDNSINLSDVDNPSLASATISISSGFISDEDVLGFTEQAGISGSYNSATGFLTLTGLSSIANYQLVLRSITYTNNDVNLTPGNRVISFQVSDGINSSSVAAKTIGVRLNTAPVIRDIFKTGEPDQIMRFSSADFINAYSDVDGDSMVGVKFLSLPDYGTLKINSIPVVISDHITTGHLNSLTFVPDSGWVGETEFAWQAYDGKAYSAFESVSITIDEDSPDEVACGDTCVTVLIAAGGVAFSIFTFAVGYAWHKGKCGFKRHATHTFENNVGVELGKLYVV